MRWLCCASSKVAEVKSCTEDALAAFEFSKMDADGNGNISADEVADWLKAHEAVLADLGLSQFTVPTFLAHVDRNRDGRISREEVVAWVKRFSTALNSEHGIELKEGGASKSSSGYGSTRFIAHNKYLVGCLTESHDTVARRVSPRRLLCTDVPAQRRFFAHPDQTLVFEMADGSTSGNFVYQLDDFVSAEEAAHIVRMGSLVQERGHHASSGLGNGSGRLRRNNSSKVGERWGAVAFDNAYLTAWGFLMRAKPWLPVIIREGDRQWRLKGVNPRIRLVSYEPGTCFGLHFDATRWCIDSEHDAEGLPCTDPLAHNHPDTEANGQHTFFTMNLYLNHGCFSEGEMQVREWLPEGECLGRLAPDSWKDDGDCMTALERVACEPQRCASGEAGGYTWRCGEAKLRVAPLAGRMLLFGQGRLGGVIHEALTPIYPDASPLPERKKWILRADVTYELDAA